MQREEATRYGRQLGLITSSIGFLIALLFTGAIGLLRPYLETMPLIVVGAGALVVACGRYGGGIAAERVFDGGDGYLNGILLALADVVIPTVLLTLPFTLDSDPVIIFVALYWILLYGFIPMSLLGVCFGYFVQKVRAQ